MYRAQCHPYPKKPSTPKQDSNKLWMTFNSALLVPHMGMGRVYRAGGSMLLDNQLEKLLSMLARGFVLGLLGTS